MAPFGRRVFAACIAALGIAAALVLVAAPDSPATPDTFVTMDDGIEIAVGIRLPNGYVEGKKYPTIFEMSGYDGASAQGETLMGQYGPEGAPLREDSRQLTQRWEGEYVTVHASVRGSGCSGGEFDLFGRQNALDGKEIIDNWIPRQPWSNGDVAIVGHSYSGITGFMVATEQPNHLRAVSVSGVIDDLYRGIVYPGGVQNYGFPLLWTGAIRPFYDVGGGLLPGLVRAPDEDEDDDGRHADDPDRQQHCATAATTKSRAVTNDPIVQGISPTDNDWYRARSPINIADKINVPLHITGAYQDEQTGPRGPTHLWEAATGSPSKRLLLLNGDHGSQNPGSTGPEVWGDRKAFIDHFLLDRPYRAAPVTVLWEFHRNAEGNLVSNGRTDAADWPLPETTFTDWYLTEDGSLSTTPPAAGSADAPFPYVTGSPRQGWSYQAGPTAGSPFTTSGGPDQVLFTSPELTDALAIHGPITATLNIATTAPDTDLFVELADDAPDGSRTFLQRGMLKASHRAINPDQSDYFQPDNRPGRGRAQRAPAPILYRPWRPHSNLLDLVTPGQVTEYLVEIFPVGHVFRPGHKIVVIVHAPPLVDSYYAYAPVRAPAGVNTLYAGPGALSRIMLPVVGMPSLGAELACGKLEGVRCVPAP